VNAGSDTPVSGAACTGNVVVWVAIVLALLCDLGEFFATLAVKSFNRKVRPDIAKCTKTIFVLLVYLCDLSEFFATLAVKSFKRGVRQLIANAAPEHLLFRFFLSPESMPRAMDKDVFQSGLTHRH